MDPAAKFEELAMVCRTGNFGALSDLVAEDVEWWQVGASQPIRGKANLMAQEQTGLARWSISPSVHDVLMSDDHLVALVEAVAKRGDGMLEYRTVEIFHVNNDGKITHRWSFAEDTEAVKAFFS